MTMIHRHSDKFLLFCKECSQKKYAEYFSCIKSICRNCILEMQKKYRVKIREKKKQRDTIWIKNNREKFLKIVSRYDRNYKLTAELLNEEEYYKKFDFMRKKKINQYQNFFRRIKPKFEEIQNKRPNFNSLDLEFVECNNTDLLNLHKFIILQNCKTIPVFYNNDNYLLRDKSGYIFAAFNFKNKKNIVNLNYYFVTSNNYESLFLDSLFTLEFKNLINNEQIKIIRVKLFNDSILQKNAFFKKNNRGSFLFTDYIPEDKYELFYKDCQNYLQVKEPIHAFCANQKIFMELRTIMRASKVYFPHRRKTCKVPTIMFSAKLENLISLKDVAQKYASIDR